MADYISSLTGVQVDAALLDMAEHNSEAYAVGERNGIEVPPDDVTYHNNARYYAQQAQSIAPASVTEAVRWDVAQTALTDAQREQARENIKATSYNYNLLNNSWFFVNQRGQNSYTSNGYTVDRWRTTNSNGTVTVNSSGVRLAANSNGNAFLVQYTSDGYEGVYTYSAYIKGSGAGYIGVTNADRSTVLSSKTFNNVGDNWTLISGTFTTSGTAIGTFTIRVNSGTSIDIKSVKLELGSVSTLANDAPPDYGTELLKCQRYFIRLKELYAIVGSAYCISATSVWCYVPLPVTLRAIPTVSFYGVYVLARSFLGVTNLVVQNTSAMSANAITLTATVSGATTDQAGLLQIRESDGYIDLSADL